MQTPGTPWRVAYEATISDWHWASTYIYFSYSSTGPVKFDIYYDPNDDDAGHAAITCYGSTTTKVDVSSNTFHDPGSNNIRRAYAGHETGHSQSINHIAQEEGIVLMGFNPNPGIYYIPQLTDTSLVNQVYPYQRKDTMRKEIPWSIFDLFLILLILFLGAGLSSCYKEPIGKQIETTSTIESKTYTYSSYITAFSLQELAGRSDSIVQAKMTQFGEVFNSARDINEASKPDPRLFAVGQIYEFELQRSITNVFESFPSDSFLVVQSEGHIPINPGAEISEEDIRIAKAQDDHIPFEPGSEYILFLRKSITSSGIEPHFTGVAHPWRFLVYQGCIYPETPWEDAQYYFPVRPLDEFLAQIEKALASDSPIPTAGWPIPTLMPTSSRCAPYPHGPQPLPLSGTPYP